MKKRIVSMLLVLTLLVSEMPAGITVQGVNAAEISGDEAIAETEETRDIIGSEEAYETELRSETGDLCTFYVSKDGKAVGSDGIVYDDVTYLSIDTIKSFDAEGQSAYIEICDQIAEEKSAGDFLENAVIAVDGEGNLLVQRQASMKLLQTFKEELVENAFEDTAASENETEYDGEKAEELLTQEHIEEHETENVSDVFEIEAESEITDIEETVQENLKAESSEEVASVEEEEQSTAIEETMVEDAASNEAVTEDTSEEEQLSEENTTEEISIEERETAIEEPALSAENMELIYKPEVEEFEIVENAKADVIIDLGYDMAGDMQQYNSILPASDWFSKQLTNGQKSIYNASKVLGKGKNSFTIAPSSMPEMSDILQAVSAYMITEPYKCDWIDLTQPVSVVDIFLVGGGSKKYQKTTITYEKSKYYTPEIQKAANAKVLEIAAEAQEYAIENYPAFPVYGVVEYFDKWICEHNYYEIEKGVLTENDYAIDDKGNLVIKLSQEKEAPYFYCHSSYGALLQGYGVCESYALAMTRLLDAIGIPNMYATGIGNGGGHAWNYVEMPDGKWYLQDSTWNEVDFTSDKVNSASTQSYLLCGDDANESLGHKPQGTRYTGLKNFEFVGRSSSYYQPPKDGEIIFSKRIVNLVPKQKEELVCNNAYTEDKNVAKAWLSSDEKVVKVDQKGVITAVAPGVAAITYVVAGISDTCIVTVSQIDSVTFDDGGKPNLTASGSIVGGNGEEQHILLTVNQKNAVYTAEDLEINENDGNDETLNDVEILPAVDIKPSDPSIATVTYKLTGDTIDLKLVPVKEGKTKIVITYGKKKATLNYSVGQKLDEKWFKLEQVDELVNNKSLPYTGKAYKPKVELSDEGKAKKVKFKVSYLNNKDAGNASVIITGTGIYGGEIRRTFKINPLTLNVDSGSTKIADSNIYNGGVNQAKSTVKHLNGTKKVGLKAGKDYYIEYTKGNITTDEPKETGIYTMKIIGKGNYAGEAVVSGTYEIKPNDIKKVKVSVKVNGTVPVVTVTMGKNKLPQTDYKISYYTDKKCTDEDKIIGSVFLEKTSYYVKIEAAGANLTNQNPIVKGFKTK